MTLAGKSAALAAAFIAVAVPGMAEPAAPRGWDFAEESLRSVYSVSSREDVELRLFPADTARSSLNSWFGQRMKKGVQGLGAVEFGDVTTTSMGAVTAIGLSGSGRNARFVLAIGCARPDGAKRYAELILPQDLALVEQYATPAAEIVGQACLETVTAAAPVKPDVQPSSMPAPTGAAKAPAPGSVIKDSEVAGVLYSWDQIWQVTGLQYRDNTYLLLTDGTARDGVPDAALQDFDVQADRRANPGSWGTWRRSGEDYLVRFGGEETSPPGQVMREKGKRGERLNNTFEWASSYTIADVSSWSNWGLQLSSNGTFRRWNSRGAGGGSAGGVFSMSTGDDKGAVSSSSGGGFSVGSSNSTGITDDDLEGSYTIDGWSMELRYRSGKVERGFFFTNDDRTTLWFEGNELFVRSND